MNVELRKLRQSRYYQAHKNDLKPKRRRRHRRERLNTKTAYRICEACRKKVTADQWGLYWKPVNLYRGELRPFRLCGVDLSKIREGFYHRPCLTLAIKKEVLRQYQGAMVEVETERGYKYSLSPEEFADKVIETGKGDNYGAVFQSFLKSGF